MNKLFPKIFLSVVLFATFLAGFYLHSAIFPQEINYITEIVAPDPEPKLEVSEAPVPLFDLEYEDHHLYAMQYLGYAEEGIANYPTEEVDFLYIGGDEYILLIPRYHDMMIEVYRNDITTDEKTLLHSSHVATPIVFQCNESDIYPNLTVRLYTSDGRTTEITPYTSLRDGSFVANQDGLIPPETSQESQ